MVSHRALVRLALLTATALILAGCSGSGKRERQVEEYQGQFREFELYLVNLRMDSETSGGWVLYEGARVDAWAFSPSNGQSQASVPGPTIRVREGDTVRITFSTATGTMAHTIHWHGLHVPWNQDGVPYVSQLPIGDSKFGGHGQTISYEFPVHQSGTYWYHCHVDTAHHVDMGMYGAIIVEPKDPAQDPPVEPGQDFILMLDEWDRSHAHQNQAALTSALSRSGDPRVTANDLYAFMRDYLLMHPSYNDTVARNLAGNPAVRETRDWYPITYAPYFAEYDTYLINGHAYPNTEMLFVKSNTTMRMRFINAGNEIHAMHLHGHHMKVTHKDGYLLSAPYYADTILMGPGERYDAYVYLDNPGPWMLHDHISLNEVNDYISPGGMMTMVCYTDGWTFPQSAGFKNECDAQHAKYASGHKVQSGDFLMSHYQALLRADPSLKAPSGGKAPSTSASAPSASGTGAGGVTIPAVPVHAH